MSYLRLINSVLKITLFSSDFYCTKVSGRIFYMVLLNVLRYRKFGNKTLKFFTDRTVGFSSLCVSIKYLERKTKRVVSKDIETTIVILKISLIIIVTVIGLN